MDSPTFEDRVGNVFGGRPAVRLLDLECDFGLREVLRLVAGRVDSAREDDVDVNSVKDEFRLESLCEA